MSSRVRLILFHKCQLWLSCTNNGFTAGMCVSSVCRALTRMRRLCLWQNKSSVACQLSLCPCWGFGMVRPKSTCISNNHFTKERKCHCSVKIPLTVDNIAEPFHTSNFSFSVKQIHFSRCWILLQFPFLWCSDVRKSKLTNEHPGRSRVCQTSWPGKKTMI